MNYQRLPWSEQLFEVVDLLGVPVREVIELDYVMPRAGYLEELFIAPIQLDGEGLAELWGPGLPLQEVELSVLWKGRSYVCNRSKSPQVQVARVHQHSAAKQAPLNRSRRSNNGAKR